MDLKEKSKELDEILITEVETWRHELKEVEAQIERLNAVLASSEAKGDRSENAVFQIAKDDRDMKVEKQRILLNKLGAFNDTQTEYTPTGKIKEGTTVELTLASINGIPYSGSKSRFIFKIVPHHFDSARKGLLSRESKAGLSLLNHTAGEQVEAVTNMGLVVYKIERIY